ncbi:MAG TPA: hypothetical protein VKV39_20710 [Candidatus Sulfotelmatobacter sp.]|nr:hypothetical protein [Candidatus Sulfotelmatobacter sp.]
MDWQKTFERLQTMVGRKLGSISGKSDIILEDVDESHITISAKTSAGKKKTVRRSTEELKGLVSKMKLGVPIHVDSEVHGSGSSRNQPETILANMPDVEWVRVQGRKHVVWVGKKTHKRGTLREQ